MNGVKFSFVQIENDRPAVDPHNCLIIKNDDNIKVKNINLIEKAFKKLPENITAHERVNPDQIKKMNDVIDRRNRGKHASQKYKKSESTSIGMFMCSETIDHIMTGNSYSYQEVQDTKKNLKIGEQVICKPDFVHEDLLVDGTKNIMSTVVNCKKNSPTDGWKAFSQKLNNEKKYDVEMEIKYEFRTPKTQCTCSYRCPTQTKTTMTAYAPKDKNNATHITISTKTGREISAETLNAQIDIEYQIPTESFLKAIPKSTKKKKITNENT